MDTPEEKRIKWTVEFSISPLWIQDGFELTERIAQTMIEKALPYAYAHELGAKIVKAPPAGLLAGIRKGK